MRYTSVDHISYTVSDLDESIRFYTLLLGEEPFLRKVWDQEYVGVLTGYDRIVLDGAFWQLPGGTVLELLKFDVPDTIDHDPTLVTVGASHLGLVCDDLASEVERLRAAGVRFRSDLVTIPWGPYKGGLAAFALDPDGIFIELFQLPPDRKPFEE